MTAPLSIWLVTASYAPHVGGLQTLVAQLAGGLQMAGHRVRLFTQRSPHALPAREMLQGVLVERWFFLLPQWGDLRRGRLDLFFAGAVFFPLTLARLCWRIARERPTIIHAHFASEPALFVALARFVFPFRFVLTLHGDDVEGAPHRSRFGRWLFQFAARRADVVTACSQYLLEQAQRLEPTLANKSQPTPNGLALSTLPPTIEGAHWLCVARLMPKKGVDVLLHALHLISDPPLVWLVGDGPEKPHLAQLLRTLQIESFVQLRGALSRSETMELMAQCALVIVPSRQEPFGLVALEAMAFGKPVVASRVGGLPEVLAEAEAVLIPPDNPAALAEGLRQARERLKRDPQFGQRNRAWAANFSLDRMLARYLAAYTETV